MHRKENERTGNQITEKTLICEIEYEIYAKTKSAKDVWKWLHSFSKHFGRMFWWCLWSCVRNSTTPVSTMKSSWTLNTQLKLQLWVRLQVMQFLIWLWFWHAGTIFLISSNRDYKCLVLLSFKQLLSMSSWELLYHSPQMVQECIDEWKIKWFFS